MIERLLAADAALERDDLETAEKLFVQVADADPRNAIAAVGLGRVAAGRDDAEAARTWFRRALEIDPDEAAAQRLLDALDREVPPAVAAPAVGAAAGGAATPPAVAPHVPPSNVPSVAPRRRSLVDRLFGWLRPRRSVDDR